jgi:flagellar hook-length control protein FliK
MEDLSVKTKSLNPATLAAAPGQNIGGADKDSASSPANALAAAFSQFLRKAAAKPDHMLTSARGQVFPFDIAFGRGRADSGPHVERADVFAPRSDVAPTQPAPDDRRPVARDSGPSITAPTPNSHDDHASRVDAPADNGDQSAHMASSATAPIKGENDGSRVTAKTHDPDTADNDERGRGRKKKLAVAATAKDDAAPRERALVAVAEIAAVAASKNAEKSQDDGADEHRRQTGLVNALNQLAKQPRGPARAGTNAADTGDQSNVSGEAEDAAAEKDDGTTKKIGARGDARARQAADLAGRVGSDTRMSVEVTVTDESKSLVSRPTAALFAPHDDKSANPAGRAGMEADVTPEQAPIGDMTSDVADDIAARLMLLAGASGMTAAPQASVEGDKAAIQVATQGIAPGSAAAARALENAGQTNAAQNAQRPAANFRAEVLEQVSVNIQKAIKDGADRITIQLRPAELGRIEVRIEVSGDGRTLVHVSADRADTLDLLQRDARDLARSLQDAGLRADAGNLQFSLREQAAENRERRFHGAETGGSLPVGGADAETAELPVWTPTVRLGRVDIRA